MNFHLLDDHDSIGWDFDGTLGDHKKAKLMWDYIKAHPEKKHYIVTFRSGVQFYSAHGLIRWAEEGCWVDLLDCGSGLTEKHFVAILNMDDDMFNEHCVKRTLGGIILPATDTYIEWKGKVCAEHGITVLIDDNADHTLQGCDKYGVTYVDPDDLTGVRKNIDL